MQNLKSFIFCLVLLTGLSLVFPQEISCMHQIDTTLEKQVEIIADRPAFLSSQGLSLFTSLMLSDIQADYKKSGNGMVTDPSLIRKYNLLNINDILYTNAFLLVSRDYDPDSLSRHGFIHGSSSGRIVTGLIPVNTLSEIASSDMVQYIHSGEPVKPLADNARDMNLVNLVHQGFHLPQGYKGKGVIVGIIDVGFDYTHPAFYDSSGANFRIQRVWEQGSSGRFPPRGFSYGRELTRMNTILNAQTDNPEDSHGTHVAGIAAGGGAGFNSKYKGMAPESEIVLVATNLSTTGVADGLKYIFKYADQQNMPCVVNFSLGSHIGPHDGTSFFDQFCDGLAGQGRILVGAAGNSGAMPLHTSHSFNGDTVQTLIYFEPEAVNNDGKKNTGEGYVNIWGSVEKDISFAVNILNEQGVMSASTSFLHTAGSESADTMFITVCGDTVKVRATSEARNINNNKPQILLYVNNRCGNQYITVELTSPDSDVYIWNHGLGRGAELTNNFPGRGIQSHWLNGNTKSTVIEIGGTGKSMISVGAYNSKNEYTDIDGILRKFSFENGAIASFSSKGPTADGRIKPDITAPGNLIASSVNRFDEDFTSNSRQITDTLNAGSNTYWYAVLRGTSMAAPMVAGTMALWLQADPSLDPVRARELLINNSRSDHYTGVIPPKGNNTWGWGKIDAYTGLRDILTITSVNNARKFDPQISVFPNPSDGQINIIFSKNASNAMIDVYDLTGTLLKKQFIGLISSGHFETLDILDFKGGIYIIKVETSMGTSNHRIIKR